MSHIQFIFSHSSVSGRDLVKIKSEFDEDEDDHPKKKKKSKNCH